MRCYLLILVLWTEKGKLAQQTTIVVKTFGTLCVSGKESAIQVAPLSPWKVLGVTSRTPFTYLANVKDLNFVQGGGGNLVKAVFMSVHCRLAANSIQKNVKRGEVSQHLLTTIVARSTQHSQVS